MTWNALAIVVEPPVAAANALLEEVRRFANRVGGLADVRWLPPHRYAASLAVMPLRTSRSGMGDGDDQFYFERVEARLGLLLRDLEEFTVHLEPLGARVCEDKAVIESRLVSVRPEVLESFLDAAEGSLGDLGLRTPATTDISVAVGLVSGKGREAIEGAFMPKETPIASWLLGGFCLARASVEPEVGLLEAERIRFIPFRRPGLGR